MRNMRKNDSRQKTGKLDGKRSSHQPSPAFLQALDAIKSDIDPKARRKKQG